MAVKKAASAKKAGSVPNTVPAAKATVKRTAVKSPTKTATKTPAKISAKTAAVKHTARTAVVNAAARVTTKPAATAKSTATKVVATAKSTATKVAATAKSTATKVAATAAPSKARTDMASTASTASTAKTPSVPQRLRVRQDETPWTPKELREVRAGLEADITRLRAEISSAEFDLAGLMRDAGDGAGDDQADAGTKTFEREQEISLANNARQVFDQSQHALGLMIQGTYGICESCSNPIGKNRLLAFPRATLCVPCKSKQERR